MFAETSPPEHQLPHSTATASRVLVIGAGVAGSAAAIRLAHHGCEVTLVERTNFPREKICGCCLGAAGLRALDAIGLGDDVRELGTPTSTFLGHLLTQRTGHDEAEAEASSPPRVVPPIRLAITRGVAVSRAVLDEYLIDQARRQGVRVWQPSEAQVVATEGDRTWVRYRHRNSSGETGCDSALESRREFGRDFGLVSGDWQLTDEFDLVIIATGLTGVFSGGRVPSSSQPRWQLPWIESPHGPLGIAAHLPATHPLCADWEIPEGEIQMICNDEGYVGLVRLPGGAIDIAAALRSQKQGSQKQGSQKQTSQKQTSRKPFSNQGGAGKSSETANGIAATERLMNLLSHHPGLSSASAESLGVWLCDHADLMTAPPLRRRRQSGEGRVVAVGDCAGYVEPMTGEGMTWGIESGLAVADLWCQPTTHDDFAKHWQTTLRTLQPKRRILCAHVTRAMRSRWVRNVTRFGLTHAPWLAKPITRGLAKGPRFKRTQIPHGGAGDN